MSFTTVDDEPQVPEGRDTGHAVEVYTPPYYTYILVACIAAVYIAQFATSSDPEFLQMDRYSAMVAGFDKQEFLRGEYWRIMTGAIVHSGILHVLMNCYAFYSFGRLVELLSNRAHLAIVFILSAIGGGVLSLMMNPEVTSVGASGGIVGLLSYLAVYAFRRKQFIDPAFRRSLIVNIGFILLFGLALYNVIDNFGHIGGLIVGAIYGLVQIPGDEYVDPRATTPIVRGLGLACVGLYILTAIFTILLLVNAPKI